MIKTCRFRIIFRKEDFYVIEKIAVFLLCEIMKNLVDSFSMFLLLVKILNLIIEEEEQRNEDNDKKNDENNPGDHFIP